MLRVNNRVNNIPVSRYIYIGRYLRQQLSMEIS